MVTLVGAVPGADERRAADRAPRRPARRRRRGDQRRSTTAPAIAVDGRRRPIGAHHPRRARRPRAAPRAARRPRRGGPERARRRAGRDRRDPRPPPHRLDRDARSRSRRPSTRSARPPRSSSSASARTAWSRRPPTATMLLGAVLSDTVILNSPTTTERDNAVVEYLERVLALDATEFGREMFEETSDVSSVDADDIVRRDAKEYEVGEGRTICIAQIETVGLRILERRDELLEALERLREAKDYLLYALMVTDILAKGTEDARRGRSRRRSSAPSAQRDGRRRDRPARRHEPQEAGRTQAPGRAVSVGPQPSASYSFTIRVQLPHTAGSFAKVARRDRRHGRDPRRDRPRPRRGRAHVVRDVTVACADVAARRGRRGGDRALEGVSVQSVSDRTFLMHEGGKIERRAEGPDQDARRPLDGLHAGRRARVAGDPRRPRQGVDADDQGQHGRGRVRRHRGARARRHRPGGGDAGDGGQGDALQGVRRRRRLPAVPRHQGRRRDRRVRQGGRAGASAASTSRTSRRRAASRSSAGCAPSSTSRSSTTTSTAPRSSSSPRCSTRCASSASAPGTIKVVVVGAGAAGVACAEIILAHGVGDLIVCDIEGALYAGRPGPRPRARGARRAHEPAAASAAWPTTCCAGADVLIGVSGPGAVSAAAVRTMAPRRDRLRDGQPGARGPARGGPRRRRDHGHRAARTTRTRSTTCSPSPASSAARSTSARSTINEEMKLAAARAIGDQLGMELRVGLRERQHLVGGSAERGHLDRGPFPALGGGGQRGDQASQHPFVHLVVIHHASPDVCDARDLPSNSSRSRLRQREIRLAMVPAGMLSALPITA